LGLLPFFPLASGLLTGKYKRGEAAPDARVVDVDEIVLIGWRQPAQRREEQIIAVAARVEEHVISFIRSAGDEVETAAFSRATSHAVLLVLVELRVRTGAPRDQRVGR